MQPVDRWLRGRRTERRIQISVSGHVPPTRRCAHPDDQGCHMSRGVVHARTHTPMRISPIALGLDTARGEDQASAAARRRICRLLLLVVCACSLALALPASSLAKTISRTFEDTSSSPQLFEIPAE